MNEFQQSAQFRVDLRPDRRHFSRIGAGFLIYNLLATGFLMTALTLVRMSGWNYLPYAMEVNRVLSFACMYLLAFPITVWYFRMVPKFGSVRNEKWEFSAWVVVFLIGTALAYLGNIVGNLVTEFFNVHSGNYQGLMDMIQDGNMFLTFLTVVIGAPIVEELLFRKFLIDRVIGYGEKCAVLLSGILFGLMHGNLNQFFYAFALGCLFAYIYCKTGEIRNTIFFHMLINLGGGVIVPLLMRPLGDFLAGGHLSIMESVSRLTENPLQLLSLLLLEGYAIVQLLAALAGLILFFVFKKYIRFYPGIRRLSSEQLISAAVVNGGMAAFLILCLVTFLS